MKTKYLPGLSLALMFSASSAHAASFAGPLSPDTNDLIAPTDTEITHLSTDINGTNMLGVFSFVSADGRWVSVRGSQFAAGQALDSSQNDVSTILSNNSDGFVLNLDTNQRTTTASLIGTHNLTGFTDFFPIGGGIVFAASEEEAEFARIDLNAGTSERFTRNDITDGLTPDNGPQPQVQPSADYQQFAFVSVEGDNDGLLDLFIKDRSDNSLTRIPVGLSLASGERAEMIASANLDHFLIGTRENDNFSALVRVSRDGQIDNVLPQLPLTADEGLIAGTMLISDDGVTAAFAVRNTTDLQSAHTLVFNLNTNQIINEYRADAFPAQTTSGVELEISTSVLPNAQSRNAFPKTLMLQSISRDNTNISVLPLRLRATLYVVSEGLETIAVNQDATIVNQIRRDSISADGSTIAVVTPAPLLASDNDESTLDGVPVGLADTYLLRRGGGANTVSDLIVIPDDLVINSAVQGNLDTTLQLTARDLFAIEVSCTSDPAFLSLNGRTAGDVFPAAPQSLSVDTSNLNQNLFAQATTLSAHTNDQGEFVAAPDPLNTTGTYARLSHSVQPVSGTTQITCNALGSDANGLPLNINVSNATVTLDNGINPVDGNGQTVSGVVLIPAGVDFNDVVVTLTIDDVSVTTTVDANGFFSFSDIRMADIVVSVDAPRAVAMCSPATVGSESVSLSDIELVRGDINNDNVINVADVTFLSSRFGLSEGDARYRERADLNRDGTINIQDLAIIGSALGKEACDPNN